MSYNLQGIGAPHGAPTSGADESGPRKKGSIRAARELMEAAAGVQQPLSGQRQRAGFVAVPGQRMPPQTYTAGPGRSTPPSTAASSDVSGTSSPARTQQSPSPQWPFRDGGAAQSNTNNSPERTRTTERGPPPPRPPRPNDVPTTLSPSQLQNANTRQQVRPQPEFWIEDDEVKPPYPSKKAPGPLATPAPAQQPRRGPALGPPPSARRGPSSYYPQSSYVAPIAEESESLRTRGTHDSYASSTAIPVSVAGFPLEDGDSASSSDDEHPNASGGAEDERRDTRAGDRDEQSDLVRKASLGKRSKPTLTTIRSGDHLRTSSQSSAIDLESSRRSSVTGQTAGGAPTSGLSVSNEQSPVTTRRPSSEILRGGTGLLDPSSSSASEASLGKGLSKEYLESHRAPEPRPRSPRTAPVDPRVEQILGGLEKGGALDAATAKKLKSPAQQSSLSDRVGSKVPSRLNVDAVREAEARGSLTSLPELIRRATKLASNLDRGRTASRLGMGWLNDGGSTEKRVDPNRRSGSLSDILDSFPPPGEKSRPGSRDPSGDNIFDTPSGSTDGPNTKRKRRCCGMPLWTFILLWLILIIAVAAAIIVPIVLVVVPHQKNSNSASNSAVPEALANCQKTLPCANGGTSIVSPTGSCRCLCVNGYTGATCTQSFDPSCTTTNVDSASGATVGSAIPRLLRDSNSNFSIPLVGSNILSLFSATNLSCTSENALVTFNGLASRSLNSPVLEELLLDPSLPTPASTFRAVLARRQASTLTSDLPAPTGTQAVATSDGIVYAAGTATAPASSSSTSSAVLATSSSTTPSSSSSTSSTSPGSSLDFARCAVLLILQDSMQLSTAINAQDALQMFFRSGQTSTGQTIDAKNVSLGAGYAADLERWTVVLANGTTVGGKGSGRG
ncbi:hypothetical protein B0A49_02787 [Cryomyces minteri]|uniref:EGF-like domain-containing protein n=1 Tax=Cryomyces minteri TaxID=331657 RepID=A0A4V5NJ54_9PEZI|nr:hypothetical protein B0A49_02787 [Cryomyces minteri]